MFTIIYAASALFTLLFLIKNFKIYREQWEVANRLEMEKNGGKGFSDFWLYFVILIITPIIWPIFWLMLYFGKEEKNDD